jgi:hypothetical protein
MYLIDSNLEKKKVFIAIDEIYVPEVIEVLGPIPVRTPGSFLLSLESENNRCRYILVEGSCDQDQHIWYVTISSMIHLKRDQSRLGV